MTKKQFVALADAIRLHNRNFPADAFNDVQIGTLASFCREQNPRFLKGRWFDYIDGKCDCEKEFDHPVAKPCELCGCPYPNDHTLDCPAPRNSHTKTPTIYCNNARAAFYDADAIERLDAECVEVTAQRNELLAALKQSQTHWFVSDDYARESKDWKRIEALIAKVEVAQ